MMESDQLHASAALASGKEYPLKRRMDDSLTRSGHNLP